MSLIINYRDCDVIIPKTASSSQNRLRVKLAKSTKSIIPHASHVPHSVYIVQIGLMDLESPGVSSYSQ